MRRIISVLARSGLVGSSSGPRIRSTRHLTSSDPVSIVSPSPSSNLVCLRSYSSSSSDTSSLSKSNPQTSCPKCGAQLSWTQTPCPKCSTLLPLPSQLSHHSILNLSSPIPKSTSSSSKPDVDIPSELSNLPAYGYEVDTRDLRNRMLQRQRELHPDKFHGQGAGQDLAETLSGRVNLAYEVLVDPLRRAEYILSVHDLATNETDSLTDPGLLAEIMEAREELDEAETSEQVEALRETNAEKVKSTIASITEAFKEVPPNLGAVKALSVQLKYWKNLDEAAREWTPRS